MASHAVYDAILGSGNNLRQVLRTGYNGNAQVIAGSASGAADPSDYFIGVTQPRCSFETADVAGLLGIVSISAGLYVTAGTITIPFNQRSNGGTFLAGSNHFRLNGTEALIVAGQISAQQDAEAVTAAVDVHFLSSDGATAPVTATSSNALAAQAFNAQYGFGPVYINAGQIVECIGWTVDPGISVELSQHDGNVYPTKAYITRRRPTIDFIFEDLDTATTLGPLFAVMTAAAVYGKKRSAGGTFVSGASSVHLKFSFTDGVLTTETIEGSGENAGRGVIRCHGEALTATATSTLP